jgi:Glycosyl transferases group 1
MLPPKLILPQFIFLGCNSFAGYTQRDQKFALSLTQRQYAVTYIERMPSLAAWIRDLLYRLFFPKGLEKTNTLSPDILPTIYTPPMVPTFSMNSWTPRVDRWLFRRWWVKHRNSFLHDQAIIVVATPYWWNGFLDRSDFPNSLILYDKSDDLLVGARSSSTIQRMRQAEMKLLDDADHVVCSAYNMAEQMKHKKTTVIPNAVSESMIQEVKIIDNGGQEKNRICFLGAFDERWIDIDLLKISALSYPLYDFIFIGRITRRIQKHFKSVKNVILVGSQTGERLISILQTIDVFLIPFKQNTITTVVNPLKLYEYCIFGSPIVAMETKELQRYTNLIYLSATPIDFMKNIQTALDERNIKIRERRKRFAQENTWQSRIDLFLTLIDSLIAKTNDAKE